MKIALMLALIFLNSCQKNGFSEKKILPSFPENSSARPLEGAEDNSMQLPPGHPPIQNGQEKTPTILTETEKEVLPKWPTGYSVEECFKGKKTLNGKKITIRGKVIKYNSGIMKRNWLHIADGSGLEGSNDLIVTSTDTASLNDIVVVTGIIHYDIDIGSGYFFPVIIEEAKIKREKMSNL
jgi:hypothetical protein